MSTPNYVLPNEGGQKIALCPAGSYQAICCETVALGYSVKPYTDRTTGEVKQRNVDEVQYYFQVDKVDPETGKRYEVRSKALNKIFSETPMSALRQFFLQWRGHDLTPAELKPPGVNVDLAGINAMIQVVHAESGGKTYANIGSIMPLFPSLPEIQPLNYEPHQEAELAYRAKKAAGDLNGGGNGSTPAFSGQAAQQTAPVLQPQAGAAAVNMPQPDAAGNIPF